MILSNAFLLDLVTLQHIVTYVRYKEWILIKNIFSSSLREMFDQISCLNSVSDPDLTDWHIVEVEVLGPPGPAGGQFTVR